MVAEGTKLPSTDKVFLDDFRVAYAHFKATSPDTDQLADLKMPFTFCLERQTRLRLLDATQNSEDTVWEAREGQWKTFSKSLGRKEGLSSSGKASVDETFWVDIVLRNPLDTEVNLSNLTVAVHELNAQDPSSSTSFVEVETIEDIALGPEESRTVPICVKTTRAASLIFTHAMYDFLSLLPATESLASRGRRLHDTPAQRQQPTYAPNTDLKAEVEEVNHRLVAEFLDDERLILAQGERKQLKLWFSNTGARPIKEVWIVAGIEDAIWLGSDDETNGESASKTTEIIKTHNSISPGKPRRIVLSEFGVLNPGEKVEVPMQLHAESIGDQELHLLFVYRESEADQFQSARLSRYYEVHKLLETSVTARASECLDHLFLVQLELSTLFASLDVHLSQITSVSSTWQCSPIVEYELGPMPPLQSAQLLFGVNRWSRGSGSQETFDFVSKKLQDVLNGTTVENSDPPPLDLLCSHISEATQSLARPSTLDLLHFSKRSDVIRKLAQFHRHIPRQTHPYIFPLCNPASVDFVIFWEIPNQQRSGYISVLGLTLGAGHAALGTIIEEAEGAQVKRSMYAETQREKEEILDGIRRSEWNVEMNPLVLLLQEPGTLRHDFSHGPCRSPVTLTVRNYSLTHASRYVLRLNANSYATDLLPPPYTGRLTYRGTLDPSRTITLRPELWITRPGTYGLGGWTLETEVLETSSSPDEIEGRIRHRYKQESRPDDRSSLVVYDAQSG
ncbi:hypothetical protein DXG03_008956 [Asterophora parasitica]|uniref:TPPC8 second Ig-like domain-containing protein n=1 Tax=Asterophora parasitica TaxID=117018 RepID=A0A9P7GCM7_9AGAR|nr:hypothetical protein DXG03_008956 [Asterophora parasitica]